MNELLQSIKADLFSRRMLPLLAVAGVALLGALAYAAVGGASTAKPPAAQPATPTSPRGVPVSIAPASTTSAAAETPAGVQYQTQGSTRDPFLLPGGASATGAAGGGSPGSSSAGKGSSGNGKGSGSSAGGGSASSGRAVSPPSRPAPSAPASTPPSPAPGGPRVAPPPTLKPEELPFYDVSALFGVAPAKPGEPATLTPYEDMKRFEPLPMAKAVLVVFVGVISKKGADRALFALISPPILRGEGSCYPSDTHCQAIELEAGKSEELEYVKPNGETVDFELKVVKISRRSAPASAASAKALHVSRAGQRALNAAGFDAAW